MRQNSSRHLHVSDTPSNDTRRIAIACGHAVQLMSASGSHAGFTMQRLRLVVEAAVHQRRIKFYFNDDGVAVGYVIWAFLAEDAEQKIARTGEFMLGEGEWNDGENLWIIDFLAPRGNAPYILKDLRDNVFGKHKAVHYLRRRRGGRIMQKTIRRDARLGFFRNAPGPAAEGKAAWRRGATRATSTRTLIVNEEPWKLVTPMRDVTFDADDADLEAFGNAVGNARVVILGNQTHGDGNAFSLKARMVRYLHESKGFNVLALESGSFDIERVNELSDTGMPYAEAAQGAVFYMYARSRELQPFFDYLGEQRTQADGLQVIGFHSKHTGGYSLAEISDRLRLQFEAAMPELFGDEDWELFRKINGDVVLTKPQAPEGSLMGRYFARIDALVSRLSALPESGGSLLASPAYWQKTLVELKKQALRYWEISDSLSAREKAMADYLLWQLSERHPGQKMVVWTHNSHAQRHPGGAMMGWAMREQLGPSLVTVGFTGGTGSFMDWMTGEVQEIDAPQPGSLEDQFDRTGYEAGLLDLRTPALTQSLSEIRNWRYNEFQNLGFGLAGVFDLMAYTRNVVPPQCMGEIPPRQP